MQNKIKTLKLIRFRRNHYPKLIGGFQTKFALILMWLQSRLKSDQNLLTSQWNIPYKIIDGSGVLS